MARHAIKEKEILFQNETINSDYTSASVKVGTSIQNYVVSFTWDNGVGPVEMELRLEGSVDDVSYGVFTNYTVDLVETDGVIVFDVANSGMEWVRISIVHTSGTIDASCIKTMKKAI